MAEVRVPTLDGGGKVAAKFWPPEVANLASSVAAAVESQVPAAVAAAVAPLAPKASPALTGVPTAPTAAVDTNTTQLATTQFVLSQAGAVSPLMDGTVAVGTSTRFARADHRHPVDTSRAPLASPTFTGVPAAPTAAVDTSTTQLATTAFVVGQGYLKSATAASTYQPLDGDLTAIGALIGTAGLLRKTAANTWQLDTSTYLTGNQAVTLSGDATGSGATAITVTLANSGVSAGTYNDSATQVRPFTVDAKGRITGVGSAVTITPAWASITGKPTTLAGYGITDALSGSVSATQNGYFGDIFLYDDTSPSHYLQITNSANLTAARSLSINVNNADRTVSLSGNLTVSAAATISGTNTGDQTITLTGDATGSGTGSFAVTLASTSVTPGSYGSATQVATFTVDAKGRVTTAGNATIAVAQSAVTGLVSDLALKAPLASPTFTGVPAAPTAAAGTNTTQVATTAFVRGEVTALVDAAPGTLDTLSELAAALGDDPNFATTITNALALKAPLASPALTGTPTVPTAAADTNTTQAASTAFVIGQAGTASPLVNGTVAVGTSLRFARQDHVHPVDTSRAPVASPTFTGTVTAPTVLLTTADTATAATHYMVEVGTDGIVRPKTLANVRTEVVTTAAVNAALATSLGTVTVGTWQATAIGAAYIDAAIARLASPTFTGTPAAPTAAANTNTTQVATTAFVVGQAGTATPLMAGTAAVGTALRFAREDHRHGTDTTRAPLASPTFTGTTTVPTLLLTTADTATAATHYMVEVGTDGIVRPKTLANVRTEVVTTAAVNAALATSLGTVTVGTWQGSVIGASYVDSAIARLASPTFTGVPAAPTATLGTNTTQVATTAFVQAAVNANAGSLAGAFLLMGA